jgi:hypothetical protein
MFLQPEQIGDLIQSYARDTVALKEQISEICYVMKGGIEFDTAWGMSFEDREIAVKVINKRIKEENPGGPEYM